MKCPRCGSENVERDEVDNGVGMEAVGPYGCHDCHWVEEPPIGFDSESLWEGEDDAG